MHALDRRPAVSSALCYCDPKGALRWLEQAFGLEPYMVILDADSNLAHSEMRFGDGVVMIGSEWSENHRSPASLHGKNTQTVHLHLSPEMGEIDARGHARPAPASCVSPKPSSTATASTPRSIPRGTSGPSARRSRR
jgi:hypothetical protein